MTAFLIIVIVVAVIVYLLKHDAKNADIANQNAVAVNHNAILAAVEQRLLIKHLGVKKAALVMVDAMENIPEAHPVLVQLYKDAGLDYQNSYNDPKARKIVLRTLETKFENTVDQMEDEIDES